MNQDNAAAIAELEAIDATGPLAQAIKREIVRLKRASLPERTACTADSKTVRVGDTVFRATPPRFDTQRAESGKTNRKPRIRVERLTISEVARATYSGVEVRFLEDFNRARLDAHFVQRSLHGTQYFSTWAAAWEYVELCAKRSLSEHNENMKEARKLLELTKKAIAGNRKAITRKMQGVRARARGKKAS